MRTSLLPTLAAALLAGCASPQGELAKLAEQRLAMSREIAWAKHSANLPVYDPQRETMILQTMMGAGQQQTQQAPQQAGVDPAALGLESLTNMFNTGRQVQEDHQNNLQSIFDAMLGGQRR